MKNLRNYNIYFHLHTISGIFACLLLYVIFFAGSFSFFKEDISAWQKNTSRKAHPQAAINYDAFIDSLSNTQNLLGRDIGFTFRYKSPDGYVSVSDSKDSVIQKQQSAQALKNQRRSGSTFFKYNTISREKGSYEETYDLGEFLYRLHFLAQLNQVPIRIGYPFGYMLAGLVSFLFLFALITGLLLHWDKIVSNFFTFRPWAKLKTLWTDAHTALGVIGFPYQFLYAVTGLFLIINTVLVAPFSKALYKGNDHELYTDIGLRQNPAEYNYTYKPLAQKISVQPFIQKTKEMWPQAIIENVQIKNYGDSNMHVLIESVTPYDKQFSGTGSIVFHAATEKIVYSKSPASPSDYTEKIRALIYRLHFGDFGGYPLKIVYFIMGLMGCVVIVSGILIWQVARDKKHVPTYKRKFNFWTANIFLAICLSMFPVTAFTFIAVKIHGSTGQSFIYNTFFYSWLLLSVYFLVRRNLKRTNNETLLLGSFLSLGVPITNGIFSGNWPWHTQSAGATDILLLDMVWLAAGSIGLYCYYKIREREKREAKPLQAPVKQ